MQFSSILKESLLNNGDFWHGQTTSYYDENGLLDSKRSSHQMVKISQKNISTFQPQIVIVNNSPKQPDETSHYIEPLDEIIEAPVMPDYDSLWTRLAILRDFENQINEREQHSVDSSNTINNVIKYENEEDLFNGFISHLEKIHNDLDSSSCKSLDVISNTEPSVDSAISEVFPETLPEPVTLQVAEQAIPVSDVIGKQPSKVVPPLRESIPRAAKKGKSRKSVKKTAKKKINNKK
jgi:hypothetical protein